MNEFNQGAPLRGILPENPLFRLALGVVPTLAVATTLINGAAIGIAVAFTLLCSNIVIALLRNVLPAKAHVLCWLIVICAFASVAQMLLQAFFHDPYQDLGIYVPLITLNCVILARAQMAEEEHGVFTSAGRSLVMGVLFALVAACVGALRELLDSGTLLGAQVFGKGFEPMLLLKLAPGGFLLTGILAGIANYFMTRSKKNDKNAQKGGAA